jgi:protein-tyrosine phosphatase
MAVAPRPRGGEWLEDELLAWKQADVHAVVSLLTDNEANELGLSDEPTLCKTYGMPFISFPIPDYGVPDSLKAVLELLRNLENLLRSNENIVVHCRQGLGRSALIASCLLVMAGVEPEAAFLQIGAVRGASVPETEEQKQWVRAFAHDLSVSLKK